MKIRLKTFGTLEEMIKEREFSFPDGIRVEECIEVLADRYGPQIREHLLPGCAYSG